MSMDSVLLGSVEVVLQGDRRSEKPFLMDFIRTPEEDCFDLRLLWIARTLKLAKHATVTETDCSTVDHA